MQVSSLFAFSTTGYRIQLPKDKGFEDLFLDQRSEANQARKSIAQSIYGVNYLPGNVLYIRTY